MRTLGNVSDRMLAAVLPKVRASASFTQYCGCFYSQPNFPPDLFYRTCEWEPGGHTYKCGNCYNSWINC